MTPPAGARPPPLQHRREEGRGERVEAAREIGRDHRAVERRNARLQEPRGKDGQVREAAVDLRVRGRFRRVEVRERGGDAVAATGKQDRLDVRFDEERPVARRAFLGGAREAEERLLRENVWRDLHPIAETLERPDTRGEGVRIGRPGQRRDADRVAGREASRADQVGHRGDCVRRARRPRGRSP